MANPRTTEAALNLDLTQPDPARMLDFWLGGTHHFETDRAMARSIEKMTPLAPQWVRAQRQFLQRSVMCLAGELKHSLFLVAGAGLPTCGNVHEVAPGAQVVYTDINPVTVAFGRNILGDNPLVQYVNYDARKFPELNSRELFGPASENQPLAVIYVGFSYFFPEDQLSRTLEDLNQWSPEGSHLAITWLGEDSIRYAAPSVEAYARMGHPLHIRSREQMGAILGPWKVTGHGMRAASHWGVTDATEPAPPVFVLGCVAAKSTG